MFVTKKRYEQELRDAKALLNAHLVIDRITSTALRSAESALADKEDVIEELQAEVCGLHITVKNMNGNAISQGKMIRQANEAWDEATARADRAEAALEAATRISYVVALHERDVPALKRYPSLDIAYHAYNDQNGEFPHTHGYRIFALRGDNIISDVTDPIRWDETLPVSEKRVVYGGLDHWLNQNVIV